jgi:phosphomevalonate kinase
MRVFAPGKLVLTGAYAVLEGAPAIVMATSRGAYADDARTTPTPTLEVRAALGDVPCPHVDASSLFLGSRKLGLGASAAILVASLAARAGARGADLSDPAVRAELFAQARAAHASAQGGGSGVDIAASVHGGVLEYVPGVAIPRALPPGLVVTVFACGTSARTSELRGFVDQLAAASPSLHHACINELATIARSAAEAVARGDGEAFVVAVRLAARGLARLGAAAGTAIVPDGFERLEALAVAENAAFCVSGAGGGDVACHLGGAGPSPAFVAGARALGLFEIDLALDEKGVRAAAQPAAAFLGSGPVPATSTSS